MMLAPDLPKCGASPIVRLSRQLTQLAPLAPARPEPGLEPVWRFEVFVAQSLQQRRQAKALVDKMYRHRGFVVDPHEALPPQEARQLSLLVLNEQQTPAAAVTAKLDRPQGLNADILYRAELSELRLRDRRPMESTRFAIDKQGLDAIPIMAAMFSIIYVFGKSAGANCLVAEVNPRLVPFYQKHFGFEQLGALKMCDRVQAPAILLGLDFGYIGQQVQRFAGASSSGAGRNPYSHFLSEPDERALAHRLQTLARAQDARSD